ncbi:MAG: GHMP kinase [Chloroflexi bacterium]|nr:MAG: GHMP kinase [Chloroflexota bacterium]
MSTKQLYLINSSAPTRICDNGGWTDTWFAEYGAVFNIAIEPRANVQIAVYPRDAHDAQITMHAANFNDTYSRDLGAPWQKHPLLEAAIEQIGVPDDVSIAVHLHSDAPPGASLGTSAAVVVALVGALDCLTPGHLSAHEVADQAHQVETVQLGRQCGIQDQLAAAFGGINFIEMFQYPQARVSSIQPDEKILWELQDRLLVVYLGRPHDSSQVHEQVIAALEDAGADEPRLEGLRETAVSAQTALLAGDFTALGQSFIKNTEAQRALHPALINPVAQQIIDLANSHHAAGWKVNGAGGRGGSVALLMDGAAQNQRRLMDALVGLDDCQLIKPRLAREGLRRYVVG